MRGIKMHLSSKHLFLLILPFLLSFGVYFFKEEIVSNAHLFFPSYEKYSNEELDAKVAIYLQIESKHKLFKDVEEKMEFRKKEAIWAAYNLFYKKQEESKEQGSIKTTTDKHISKKTSIYKLQAVFPDDKTAIIDDSIVKEGGMLRDAKVIRVEDSKVLIKTSKGLQWLYLFQ